VRVADLRRAGDGPGGRTGENIGVDMITPTARRHATLTWPGWAGAACSMAFWGVCRRRARGTEGAASEEKEALQKQALQCWEEGQCTFTRLPREAPREGDGRWKRALAALLANWQHCAAWLRHLAEQPYSQSFCLFVCSGISNFATERTLGRRIYAGICCLRLAFNSCAWALLLRRYRPRHVPSSGFLERDGTQPFTCLAAYTWDGQEEHFAPCLHTASLPVSLPCTSSDRRGTAGCSSERTAFLASGMDDLPRISMLAMLRQRKLDGRAGRALALGVLAKRLHGT